MILTFFAEYANYDYFDKANYLNICLCLRLLLLLQIEIYLIDHLSFFLNQNEFKIKLQL